MLSSLLEEISTGTGAAFAPGAGEQTASPFAFKRKRRIREAAPMLSYTPENMWDTYQKYQKAFPDYKSKVERYINIFDGYALKDILDDITKAEQFATLGEKMQTELRKICDTLSEMQDQLYDEGDKEGSKKYQALENAYYKIERAVDGVYQAMEDVAAALKKIKEKLDDNNQ